MNQTEAYVVSVLDRRGEVLAFDLRDILRTLDGDLPLWRWCLTGLDCTGPESENICRAVAQSGAMGYWVSTDWLLNFSATIHQVIDGQFLAFHNDEQFLRNVNVNDINLAFFPVSRAVLGILAVDSTSFEVYAKDVRFVKQIQHRFREVRLRAIGIAS